MAQQCSATDASTSGRQHEAKLVTLSHFEFEGLCEQAKARKGHARLDSQACPELRQSEPVTRSGKLEGELTGAKPLLFSSGSACTPHRETRTSAASGGALRSSNPHKTLTLVLSS